MKKLIKKIIVVSCVSLITMSIVIIGVYAWSVHNLDIQNMLTSRTVEVSIEEEFPDHTITEGEVTKEVDFTNDGTAAVFLRFTYAEYWETSSELLEGYTSDEYVTKNWSGGEDGNEETLTSTDLDDNLWYDGGDGWYYYCLVLPAGESIDILESVTFSTSIPEEANYKLIFQVETVQVSDEADVNTDATELLFGITGAVSGTTIENGAVISGNVTWTPIGSGGD